MKTEKKRNRMDSLIALMVSVIFALCVLMLILTGAGIYQRVVEKDSANYEWRTLVQYLTTHVHQSDRLGGVSTGSFGESDALILSESFEEETYYTYIYCYDGYIRELFTSADSGLLPVDGEKILEARELKTADRDGLLEITVTAEDGSSKTITLMLRSGGTGSMKEGTG